MLDLRLKLVAVAAAPAALSTGMFYLASTLDGGDALFLYRLGITFAIAGVLLCIVTWHGHRVTLLEYDIAFHKARADAAEHRSDELEARVGKLEEALECRDFLKKMWTDSDDVELETLFNRQQHKDS